MKRFVTRMAALVLAFAVLCSLAVCGIPTAAAEANVPKYVFLFIGDGMTYSQFQLAASYQGANAEDGDGILNGDVALNFMNFDTLGNATTYDSSSFCPDSASTATSIASGFKTYSGVINMDETKTVPFTTVAEQLRDNTDMKIGVISSVNLNHATPAAFYA
ncbi:MAG: alkaline phosphatase, partial [Faecousia sp.]